MRRPIGRAALFIALSLLCNGCASSPLERVYRKNVHAYLKALVYCENHYPALKDTPECQAALKMNEEMFPGYYP